MPEQFGDKQHDATPHRKEQARREGQVAKSQDLGSAVVLLGGLAVLYWYGESFFKFLASFMRLQLEKDAWLTFDRETAIALWYALGAQLLAILGPMLGLILLLAILAQVCQVGFLFVPKKLALDPSRISPLKGAQRLFSGSNVVRLGFGLVKLVIVAAVATAAVWNQRTQVFGLSALQATEIWSFLVQLVLWTTVKVGIALLILALLDYGYQRWKQEQELKMTTQEVRDELRTTQGDPQVAARRKAVQRQLVMNRMGSAVPKADVVVTNPTELSIAIQYDYDTMAAPIVVAKGAGLVAQRIRRLALEHAVPIIERKELARALYKQVEIGKPIPPEQYAAMAEVLRYVYELKGKQLPDLGQAAA